MLAGPAASVFFQPPSDLGEGLLWHPITQTLWWVDLLVGHVHEIDATGLNHRSRELGQMVSALIPLATGNLIILRRDGAYQLNVTSGAIDPWARPPEHDATQLRFNDGKCDPQGRLFAGSIALDGSRNRAKLYRFDSDGSTRVILEPVSISNGLAWSPDERSFYYIDTPTGAVQVFNYDRDTGEISFRRRIDVTAPGKYPDGCTIDRDGNLWIAYWGGSCVSCWQPTRGEEIMRVNVPATQVTNCTFGGPKLDQLFITTAANGLTSAQRAAEPLAGSVFCAMVGSQGFPAVCARV